MKIMYLKVKERSLSLDNEYFTIKVSSGKETKIMREEGGKRKEMREKREKMIEREETKGAEMQLVCLPQIVRSLIN